MAEFDHCWSDGTRVPVRLEIRQKIQNFKKLALCDLSVGKRTWMTPGCPPPLPRVSMRGPTGASVRSQSRVKKCPIVYHDFMLVVHSNYGPMSNRFRDKWRFRSKIANFPTAYSYCPARRVSLKFRNGGRLSELKLISLPVSQPDRQTDRWTEMVCQYHVLHAY